MEYQNPIDAKDLLRINVENVEKHLIISVLKQTRGNQSKAAKQLGTTKRRLRYRLSKYHIDARQFRSDRESQTN